MVREDDPYLHLGYQASDENDLIVSSYQSQSNSIVAQNDKPYLQTCANDDEIMNLRKQLHTLAVETNHSMDPKKPCTKSSASSSSASSLASKFEIFMTPTPPTSPQPRHLLRKQLKTRNLHQLDPVSLIKENQKKKEKTVEEKPLCMKEEGIKDSSSTSKDNNQMDLKEQSIVSTIFIREPTFQWNSTHLDKNNSFNQPEQDIIEAEEGLKRMKTRINEDENTQHIFPDQYITYKNTNNSSTIYITSNIQTSKKQIGKPENIEEESELSDYNDSDENYGQKNHHVSISTEFQHEKNKIQGHQQLNDVEDEEEEDKNDYNVDGEEEDHLSSSTSSALSDEETQIQHTRRKRKSFVLSNQIEIERSNRLKSNIDSPNEEEMIRLHPKLLEDKKGFIT